MKIAKLLIFLVDLKYADISNWLLGGGFKYVSNWNNKLG